MILNKLSFKNFGIFKGVHEINLKPESKDKPIILFGGTNGVGKTTILDAMQLVLYGKFAKCSNREKSSYDKYLAQTMNHFTQANDSTFIGLEFEVLDIDSPIKVDVRREWHIKNNKLYEDFSVKTNNKNNETLTNNWIDFIDNHLPRNISELFFFDGEKIENLSNPKKAAQIIETSLNSLLGLDHVNQLSVDLRTIYRQRAKDLSIDVKADIETYEKEVASLEANLDEIIQTNGEICSRLDSLNSQLKCAEEKYQQKGGELYNKREIIKKNRDKALESIRAVNDEIKGFVSGDAPLFLVKNLITQTHNTALKEKNIRANREALEIIEKRDKDIISKLNTDNLNDNLTGKLKEIFSQDIEDRRKIATKSTFLDVSPDMLMNFGNDFFHEINEESNKLKTSASKLKTDLDFYEEQVSLIPEDSSIALIIENIDGLELQIVDTKKTLEENKDLQKKIVINLNLAKQKLENYLSKLNETQIQDFQNQRILDHSEKIQNTLRRYKKTLIDKNIIFLQNEISTCFESLIGKKEFISKVSIDPKTFTVSLVKNDETTIESRRLSAGERQLLAVSILWGLAKASNKNIPTIVDTPLGRLDAEHRINLIESYFPFTSDQTIIFSTDTEINNQHADSIKKFISHEYQILYNDAEQSSHISPGYFQ